MAWKNLSQRSLADSVASENKAITELDYAHNLIDWQRIERLLTEITTKNAENWHGHP